MKSISRITQEIVELLQDYRYVGVWADYFPIFAVDRNTPVEDIDYLVNRYRLEEREYFLDGTNECGNL